MVCQSGVSTLPRCQLPSSLLGISLLALPDDPLVDSVADPLAAFLVTLVDAAQVFLALAAVAWPFCVHLQCPEGQGLSPHFSWLFDDGIWVNVAMGNSQKERF